MTLDESRHDNDILNDILIEPAGIPMVFDRELEPFLQEGTLDYNFPLKWFVSLPEARQE